MARWVFASRRQQTVRARNVSVARAEAAFARLFAKSSRVIGRYTDDHDLHTFVAIFEADSAEIQGKRAQLPAADAILEPEISHLLASPRYPPAGSDAAPAASAAAAGHGAAQARVASPVDAYVDSVRILGDNNHPLAGVRVTPIYDVVQGFERQLLRRRAALVSRGVPRIPPVHVSRQQTAALRQRSEALSQMNASITDADGIASLPPIDDAPLIGVRVEPPSGYWSRILSTRPTGADIHLRQLPDGPLGWWQTLMGVDRYDPRRGSSSRIGVIDTGCGPHQALTHVVNHGAYVLARHDAAGGQDVGSHGTHVCGLIGGRWLDGQPESFAGIAPGATLHSVRVFASEWQPANQADIMLALRRLIAEGVDVVVLNVGSKAPSLILQEAIDDASDDGVLCVCAAGNDGGKLRFPAALERTASVTAVGWEGWGPEDSWAQHYYRPPPRRKHGRPPSSVHTQRGILRGYDLFLPSFSSVGPPAVDCTAPGVSIISSVPGGGGTLYGEMSGTSMACALACGALGAVLSTKGEFFGGYSRSAERSDVARGLLDLSCQTVGLYQGFQGRGLPVLK